jgi:hypothetical protein
MKKLLLASVLAIASTTATHAADKPETAESCLDYLQDREAAETPEQQADYDACMKRVKEPPARVTVTPPYQGPPPIEWVKNVTGRLWPGLTAK